jgi:ABC-type glutathione transport system ATPase component
MTTPLCDNQPATLADKLLNHANGSRTAEAAILILLDTAGGRLLDAVTLLGESDTMAEIDWPTTRTAPGHLSGGERRLLALADSLATGHPVDLADTLTGLDATNSRAVLDAIAHATGTYLWGYDQ